MNSNSKNETATHLESETLNDPLVGKTLSDRYRINSVIGDGGFGRVYAGTHLTLEIPVAIKVIHSQLARDVEKLKRFEQEAKILGKIDSPYVVKTIDYGLSPCAFLVMEYVDGKALSDVLKEKGVLSTSEAMDLFQQTCEALEAAHNAGLVHRDLKPSNIMISERNGKIQAKILDFGIAKVIDDHSDGNRMTLTGEIMGSPAYMSPEQWTGKPVDLRSDIYSLACVMYEVVSGRPAYQAATAFEYLNLHVATEMEPLSKITANRKIPRDLEMVINKCAQKDPSDRYNSTREILQDLDKICRGQKLQIKVVGRKSKRPVVLLTCILVAFIGLALSGTLAYQNKEPLLNWICSNNNMKGEAEIRRGKADEAIKTYEQTLELANNLPRQNIERLKTMRALSALYKKRGLQSKANSIDNDLRIFTGDLKPPRIENLLNTSSKIVESRGNLTQAADLCRQALRMIEAKHGKNTILFSIAIQQLGVTYRNGGRLTEAERLLNESLKIKEALCAPDDIRIAHNLYNLGSAISAQGRLSEAEQLYLRAIKIGEQSNNPNLVFYYNNLGATLIQENQVLKAIPILEKTLELDKQAGSNIRSHVLNNLGTCYFRLKQYDKSIEALEEALAVTKIDGRDHHKTGEDTMVNLASAYAATKQFDKSREMFKQAIAYRAEFNPKDPQIPVISRNLQEMEFKARFAKK